MFRDVVLLDFNHILPVGLQSEPALSTDHYKWQLEKTQFAQYRQLEAKYFSVSFFTRC